MQLKHQCIITLNDVKILVLPNDTKLGIHSQHICDYILTTKDQYINQIDIIKENMADLTPIFQQLFISSNSNL